MISWSTEFPVQQDNKAVNQPDLTNEVDIADESWPHTLRNKLGSLANLVGLSLLEELYSVVPMYWGK